MHTLKTGSLAFIDSFGGLVACRVNAIRDTSMLGRQVTVTVTGKTLGRGTGYIKGESTTLPVSRVVPRESIRRRKYSTVILPYDSQTDGADLRAENQKQNTKRQQEWLAGIGISYPSNIDGAPTPIQLRIKGDLVETSRGASFPVSHARLGLALVRHTMASGVEWRTNGHTCHLGHYRIDRITPDGTVYAGCHVVTYAAIERIAAKLERA